MARRVAASAASCGQECTVSAREQRAVTLRDALGHSPVVTGRSSPLGQQERANLGFEQRGLRVALVAQAREDPQCRTAGLLPAVPGFL